MREYLYNVPCATLAPLVPLLFRVTQVGRFNHIELRPCDSDPTRYAVWDTNTDSRLASLAIIPRGEQQTAITIEEAPALDPETQRFPLGIVADLFFRRLNRHSIS